MGNLVYAGESWNLTVSVSRNGGEGQALPGKFSDAS